MSKNNPAAFLLDDLLQLRGEVILDFLVDQVHHGVVGGSGYRQMLLGFLQPVHIDHRDRIFLPVDHAFFEIRTKIVEIDSRNHGRQGLRGYPYCQLGRGLHHQAFYVDRSVYQPFCAHLS